MTIEALVRPSPVHDAADLLTAYLPGSFFHRSPRGTLLADGVHASVEGRPGGHADAAADALRDAREAGVRDPVVVGALGFLPDAPSSLVVPAVVRRAPGDAGAAPAVRRPAPPVSDWTVRQHPAPEDYADGVRQVLDLVDDGVLDKVVLARCLELASADPVSVPDLLTRLVLADPGAYAFAADVTAPGDRATRTLVGASPELLVSRRGGVVEANPLAGSAPRSADEAENRERIAALLASEKDRHEHALVSERVSEVLGRFCTGVTAPAEPAVIGTATMWHLSSRIAGRLADDATTALHLAEALHPTPAVCGVPPLAARSAINEVETVDRGYYSGLVGWVDASGDGEWVVTIRSAEVCEATLRLFAGAGVVGGSVPESELAETAAKFRTLLRAIGVEAAP
ncbi:isochorismate synthase [Pseudonocardia sediminis]|uniref:isochorismate synthase n=1 Tax=Pseudonocardia sediminis TaxID=1397368 RepID=A0A4Q7UV69_PSEST|nr:isochorismate synthase [Pseudonocardia sediminis]RZT85867.1 isochorismate synthase [Pseudonocardia sediminis]